MSEKHIYRTPEDKRMYESSYLKIDEAHERAKEVLTENEIKLAACAGLYDDKVIAHDAEKVKRFEDSFEPSPSKTFADILEAVVCEHGELSDWFGPESRVIKTSRFDDYIHKIDMLVETDTGNSEFSHLALGMDVTFGTDLQRKFAAIKANIDSGALGEVKYFRSDRQHAPKHLRKVPQVVVGVEIERVKEIGLLWMNRKNKILSGHPVQVTILEEAALQLKTFAAYAKSMGKEETSRILETELRKIHELLEEKKKNGIKGIKNDKVFEEIKRNLHLFH